MKPNKHLFARVLMVLVLILAYQTTWAQFYPPVTPDNPTGATLFTNPPNSGNDAQENGAGILHVMVWDGANPTLSWDDNGTTGSQAILGTATGTVTDPDVVADPGGSGYTIIVYTHTTGGNSRIFYEVLDISGSTAITITGPTQLSGPTQTACSNPNVDVSANGDIVVVYQNIQPVIGVPTPFIFAKATTFSSLTFAGGPGFNVSVGGGLSNTASKTTPDVAVHPTGAMVNFVFINNDGTNKSLILRRALLTNVTSGTGMPYALFTLESVPVSDVLGRPRIAAPWSTSPATGINDCHVVVQRNDDIVGYTHDSSAYGGGVYTSIVINSDYSLNSCINYDPATSYVGDFIIDVWTYEDTVCGNYFGYDMVLARQLTWNGATYYPDYSILSNTIFGNQRVGSISGRLLAQVTADGYYLWWDEGYADMMYKSSYYFNSALKTSTGSTSIANSKVYFNAYPNPFANELSLDFTIVDMEMPKVLEVFDITGKQIFSQDISTLVTGHHHLDMETDSWLPGIYLVRLSTNQQVHNSRIVKQ